MNEATPCERCSNPATHMARQSYHDSLPMCEPCFLEFDHPIPVPRDCNNFRELLTAAPASTLDWMITLLRVYPFSTGSIDLLLRDQLNALMIK